jgi:hypothetical protein
MKTRLVKVGNFTYRVRCEPDFDGGNAIYVNDNLVADVEDCPTDEELVQIISDNIKVENAIKTGLAASGVFE